MAGTRKVRGGVDRKSATSAHGQAIEDKLRDQASFVLPAPQIEKLIELCWKIDTLDDVGALVKATVPT